MSLICCIFACGPRVSIRCRGLLFENNTRRVRIVHFVNPPPAVHHPRQPTCRRSCWVIPLPDLEVLDKSCVRSPIVTCRGIAFASFALACSPLNSFVCRRRYFVLFSGNTFTFVCFSLSLLLNALMWRFRGVCIRLLRGRLC